MCENECERGGDIDTMIDGQWPMGSINDINWIVEKYLYRREIKILGKENILKIPFYHVVGAENTSIDIIIINIIIL